MTIQMIFSKEDAVKALRGYIRGQGYEGKIVISLYRGTDKDIDGKEYHDFDVVFPSGTFFVYLNGEVEQITGDKI